MHTSECNGWSTCGMNGAWHYFVNATSLCKHELVNFIGPFEKIIDPDSWPICKECVKNFKVLIGSRVSSNKAGVSSKRQSIAVNKNKGDKT